MNQGKTKHKGAPHHPLGHVVMRFNFAFIHCWLAITHFLDIEEGMQFFNDERSGRNRRLKQAAIKKKFPNMRIA